MELHQLRYFVAAAELRSFSKAARACRVAQPSLSQQVKKLEDGLGTRLFDRMGRGAELTEAGRALLPRARRILAEVRDAEERLRDGMDEEAGALTIGAIPTMAPYVLPKVLKRLRRERPGCAVSVREDVTARLLESLADHEIDVALVSVPADHPLVDVEVIGKERLLVAMAKDAAPKARSVPIESLRDAPAVVLHEMHCLSGQVEGFCAARGVSPRIVCRGAQLQTALGLVALGMGVSLVPEMCAKADASSARVYLPIAKDGPERAIALAWRKGRSRSSAATLAAGLIEDAVAGG
ncbi:MAG: LysR family transcriptional regulator [Phycisphaerales bacterium]